MEISKKRLLGIIALTAILCVGFGYSAIPALTRHGTKRLRANVFIISERFDGTSNLGFGNVITNIGESQTRDRFSQNCTTSDYALYWIGTGNATGTLQTKTLLDAQHAREQGVIVEWQNSGDYALNTTYKFQFTSTVNLDAASLHWSNTGDNNMYAIANFAGGAQTYNNGENLTVRWIITYDGND